jgi:hypothetical protein
MIVSCRLSSGSGFGGMHKHGSFVATLSDSGVAAKHGVEGGVLEVTRGRGAASGTGVVRVAAEAVASTVVEAGRGIGRSDGTACCGKSCKGGSSCGVDGGGGCLGGASGGGVGSVEACLFGGEDSDAFAVGKSKVGFENGQSPFGFGALAPVLDAVRENAGFFEHVERLGDSGGFGNGVVAGDCAAAALLDIFPVEFNGTP